MRESGGASELGQGEAGALGIEAEGRYMVSHYGDMSDTYASWSDRVKDDSEGTMGFLLCGRFIRFLYEGENGELWDESELGEADISSLFFVPVLVDGYVSLFS